MAAVFRDGRDPVSGDLLGRGFQGGNAVVGFDLTFTATKSASVLWGLGDETTRAAVHAAHKAALRQALAFVERTLVRTRLGEQVKARGLIAAGIITEIAVGLIGQRMAAKTWRRRAAA